MRAGLNMLRDWRCNLAIQVDDIQIVDWSIGIFPRLDGGKGGMRWRRRAIYLGPNLR
jgi:hypothetical protein